MVAVLPVWVSPLLALIVVAVAALLAHRIAAAVLRSPDAGARPERLQQWRGQHQFVIAVAIAVLAFAGVHALWAIPLVWVILQAFVHRIRRRVFGDTWSFAAQIAWHLRALTGIVGFWWAAALAPLALIALGASSVVAVAVGLLLLAWNHVYGDVVLLALGATPLCRPELDSAFEPVLARIRIARPRLMRAGPRGASLANAFAMSSPRGDVVLFLDTLLDRTSPEEAAAILAHELGHLEDFATRRVELYAHGALLAAGAVGVTLAVQAIGTAGARWAAVVWVVIAIGSLLARAIQSQHRETASDLRAVELCGGDGETLVRALMLLHTLGLVPRRLAPDLERHATHPSLARRIRAIRAAAGVPPDLLEPRAIRAAEPTRAVVFERERLSLVVTAGEADVTSTEATLARALDVTEIPYAQVTELRLDPSRQTEGAILVVGTGVGQPHRLRFEKAELSALQAMLDLADQRTAAGAAAPPDSPLLARLFALLTTLILVASGAGLLLFLPGLFAATLPTPAILAAMGVASLLSAMLPGYHHHATQAAALVLGGVACLGVAWARHVSTKDRPRAHDRGLAVAQVAIFGVIALSATALIAFIGWRTPADFHIAARLWSVAGPVWAALGVLLLVRRARWARLASVAAFLAAATILVAGSDGGRARLAPDPLIADAAPMLAREGLPPSTRRLHVDGTWWKVHLSPDGRHVLLRGNPTGDLPGGRHLLAGLDGTRRAMDVRDARFVDADTLLTVRDGEDGCVLATERLADGTRQWTITVPDAPAGRVWVDAGGRWRLGWDPETHHPTSQPRVVVEGRIGQTTVERRPLPGAPPRAIVDSYHGPTPGAGLVVRRFFRPGVGPYAWARPGLTWITEIAPPGAAGHVVPLARSRLEVRCFGLSSPVTCLAGTDDETFVWSVDAERGRVRPLAKTASTLTPGGGDDDAVLVWEGRELLMLRPDAGRALRIADGEHCPCPFDADYAGGRVATLTMSPDRATVDLYDVR